MMMPLFALNKKLSTTGGTKSASFIVASNAGDVIGTSMLLFISDTAYSVTDR